MSNVTAGNEKNTTFRNGEQLPQGIGLFLVALNILLSVTAFLGNALILVALHKVSSVYPPTKLLFRCLAVTDLCIGLVSQPLYALHVMSKVTTNINWNVYHTFFIVQLVFLISTFVLCGVSILTSTAISVDRLLALLLGLRYRHVVTLRRVRVAIICFWFLSFALCGWMWFGGGVKAVIVLIVVITLCLLTSLFSYTKLYLLLRHHQNQSQQAHQAQPPSAGQSPLNIARYKRTVSTIAWVQLALVFCYLPFSIYRMQALFGGVTHEMGELYVFSSLYLNSSLNPILYCWKIPEVRQVVKDTIRQLNCCAST